MVSTAWVRRSDYLAAYVEVYSGHAFYWAEAVCWVLRCARKPYVLALHGGALRSYAQRWPWRVRRLLRSATAVSTPSFYLRETLQPYWSDIHVIPNGLDIALYPFLLRDRPRPRLVWLRAFHRIYNPTLAIRVVALLAQEFPEVYLSMVGPDKGDGSLQDAKRMASELGVADRIDWEEGVSKALVPSRLQRADILLNTTKFESFGVSLMEAAALGLCVVTTDVGEVPYRWRQGEDALLVPPDDPAAMAVAVRRVLTEPGLAERLSRNARKKAEGFDWSVVLPRWEALFLEVIRGG
jgi:glycosyltransferase involved in cell wall biosynthesis